MTSVSLQHSSFQKLEVFGDGDRAQCPDHHLQSPALIFSTTEKEPGGAHLDS